MPHWEDRFTTRDGLCLYQQGWLPDGDPRAVVIAVHGLSEHGGRFAATAAVLNRLGYAVYALDLRGHGRSPGPRCLVRSFDQYLDDLDCFVDHIAQRAPAAPRVLLGNSMGGLIATDWAMARQPDLSGLVLSGPVLQIPNRMYGWLRPLAGPAGRVLPRLRAVHVDFADLSRDPRVTSEFHADPLVYHGRFPVRTAAEILRATRRVARRAATLRVPFLILHGAGDRLCDPEGSRHLFRAAGARDKTLHVYDGLWHDVFHEPEADRVRGDLTAWLDARVPSRPCPAATRT